MEKIRLGIIGAGSLGVRLLGQVLASNKFQVEVMVTDDEKWSLQRLRTFTNFYGGRPNVAVLDMSPKIKNDLLADCEVVIVATEDIGNSNHNPIKEQYYRYAGMVIYCYPVRDLALIAPPFVEQLREASGLFPQAKCYYHGNCLISGLSPVLGQLGPGLTAASIQALMIPRQLRSYPTATRIHGIHFPKESYVTRHEDMLSLISGVPVNVKIEEMTGLPFYLVDLDLRFKKDVAEVTNILELVPGLVYVADQQWDSTNDLYEYLIEPGIQSVRSVPQIIAYRCEGGGADWRISLALHHPTITPWSILRAVDMLCG